MILTAIDLFIYSLLQLVVYPESEGWLGIQLLGDHAIHSVANILDSNAIFSSEHFTAVKLWNLETHSICKGAATCANWFSLTRDWVNIRGRLRGHWQQVDTYIDINLPYPDGRVASVLYGFGVPADMLQRRAKSFLLLLPRSVPNIHATSGGDAARVLALPLLWASCAEDQILNKYTFPIIPPLMAAGIKDQWNNFGGSPHIIQLKKLD